MMDAAVSHPPDWPRPRAVASSSKASGIDIVPAKVALPIDLGHTADARCPRIACHTDCVGYSGRVLPYVVRVYWQETPMAVVGTRAPTWRLSGAPRIRVALKILNGGFST